VFIVQVSETSETNTTKFVNTSLWNFSLKMYFMCLCTIKLCTEKNIFSIIFATLFFWKAKSFYPRDKSLKMHDDLTSYFQSLQYLQQGLLWAGYYETWCFYCLLNVQYKT